MKKRKAYIIIMGEDNKPQKIEVEGYQSIILTPYKEKINVIIHRNTRYPDSWNVSDLMTGTTFTPYDKALKTKKEAIQEAERFLEYRNELKTMTAKELATEFLKFWKLDPVNII